MSRTKRQPGRYGEDVLLAPDIVTDDVSELLAGYSVGALSTEETTFVERYLPERPAWRDELASFECAVGFLPYASEPQQVPVRVKAAILAQIDALAIESQEAAIARDNPPPGIRSKVRHLRRNVPKVAWAAAVPTTILAVVFIMASIVMQERISEQQNELAAYQQEQVQAGDVLLASNDGQQVVELLQSSAAPLARGRLYIDLHDNRAMLVVRNMPQPAEGHVYIIWTLIGSSQDEFAQLGELPVDELGRGQKIIDPPDNFDHYPFVRITMESDSGIGFPSGPEVLTGGIR